MAQWFRWEPEPCSLRRPRFPEERGAHLRERAGSPRNRASIYCSGARAPRGAERCPALGRRELFADAYKRLLLLGRRATE